MPSHCVSATTSILGLLALHYWAQALFPYSLDRKGVCAHTCHWLLNGEPGSVRLSHSPSDGILGIFLERSPPGQVQGPEPNQMRSSCQQKLSKHDVQRAGPVNTARIASMWLRSCIPQIKEYEVRRRVLVPMAICHSWLTSVVWLQVRGLGLQWITSIMLCNG